MSRAVWRLTALFFSDSVGAFLKYKPIPIKFAQIVCVLSSEQLNGNMFHHTVLHASVRNHFHCLFFCSDFSMLTFCSHNTKFCLTPFFMMFPEVFRVGIWVLISSLRIPTPQLPSFSDSIFQVFCKFNFHLSVLSDSTFYSCSLWFHWCFCEGIQESAIELRTLAIHPL
jgi:hypothetical protein